MHPLFPDCSKVITFFYITNYIILHHWHSENLKNKSQPLQLISQSSTIDFHYSQPLRSIKSLWTLICKYFLCFGQANKSYFSISRDAVKSPTISTKMQRSWHWPDREKDPRLHDESWNKKAEHCWIPPQVGKCTVGDSNLCHSVHLHESCNSTRSTDFGVAKKD